MVTAFPARGQRSPQFWDVQLQAYIDEAEADAKTFATQSLASALTGYWTKAEANSRYSTAAQGVSADKALARSQFIRSDVATTTDLDTVVEPGKYIYFGTWVNDSATLAATHRPVAGAFTLETTVGGGIIYQEFQLVAGAETYSRVGTISGTTVSGMSAWALVTQPVRDLLVAGLAGVFGGTALGTAATLDTFRTPGIYYQADGGQALTSRSYPVTGVPGCLIVTPVAGTPYVMQEYTLNDDTKRGAYTRASRGTGTWTAWRAILPQRVNQPAGQPGVEIYTWDDTNNVERQVGVVGMAMTSTTDLNAVQTAGSYVINPAWATTTLNYPVNTMAGTLEVMVVSAGQVIQRATAQSGVGTAGKGMYVRRLNAGTWDPWRFMSYQRMDQTAGRALYTYDDVLGREQLVYGDTGWRDLASIVTWPSGVTQIAGEKVLLRRQGSTVTLSVTEGLEATGPITLTNFYTMPVGFRGISNQGQKAPILRRDGTVQIGGVQVLTDGTSRLAFAVGTSGAQTGFSISYPTTDNWPTSLPGTAIGAIPNL